MIMMMSTYVSACVIIIIYIMAVTVNADTDKTCEYIDEVIISLPTKSGATIDATKLTLPPSTAVMSMVRLCDAACDDKCGEDWGRIYTTETYAPDSVSKLNATQIVTRWQEGRVAWTQLVDVGRFVLDVPVYDEAADMLSFAVLDGPDVDMVLDDALVIVAELVPLPRHEDVVDASLEDEASAPEEECASAANITEAFVSGVIATLTNTTLSLQFDDDMDITTVVLCNVACSDACAMSAQWQGRPLAVQYLLSSSVRVAPADYAASLSTTYENSVAIMSGMRDEDGSSTTYKLILGDATFDAVTNVMEVTSTVVDAVVVEQGERRRRRRILFDMTAQPTDLLCFWTGNTETTVRGPTSPP